MKKQLLLLITAIASINGYSQIIFEKGYYLDNSGEITKCLLKNIDWKNNPTKFRYKLSEDAKLQIKTIASVKEFGIPGHSKYIRYTVDIDRSVGNMSNINTLSTVKDPEFKKEKCFLKVLLEGKASLYAYEDGNTKRYFYSTSESDIEPLIFKNYLVKYNKIGQNNQYKKQLWTALKCSHISIEDVKKIKYKKEDLLNFFIHYNRCTTSESINFEKSKKRDLFHLTLRPGMHRSSLIIQNSISNTRDTDFGSEWGYRFGIEVEAVMPFNKNKWALLIEPTYQYFEAKSKQDDSDVNINYSAFELPIGIRHYMFLNVTSKLFINGFYSFQFVKNQNINFESGTNLKISGSNNLAFGIGYVYKNRYSIEFRYAPNRNILRNYFYWRSDYTSLSVILGYTLF